MNKYQSRSENNEGKHEAEIYDLEVFFLICSAMYIHLTPCSLTEIPRNTLVFLTRGAEMLNKSNVVSCSKSSFKDVRAGFSSCLGSLNYAHSLAEELLTAWPINQAEP